MLYGISYAIVLGWLSWEDIKQLHIPVIALIALSCLSLSETILSSEPIWIPIVIWVTMYGCLQLLSYAGKYITQSAPIGQGDICLISILASRIYPEHLPIFLILVGSLSWAWGMCWTQGKRNKRFPMVPSIGLAFIVMRIFL